MRPMVGGRVVRCPGPSSGQRGTAPLGRWGQGWTWYSSDVGKGKGGRPWRHRGGESEAFQGRRLREGHRESWRSDRELVVRNGERSVARVDTAAPAGWFPESVVSTWSAAGKSIANRWTSVLGH